MSCQTSQYDLSKKHHTSDGFRNNFSHEKHGVGDFFKWQWDAFFDVNTKIISYPLEKNDPAFLKQNRTQPTLTWIGHASFLLQIKGLNILTDPQLSERASPFSFAGPSRKNPPGLNFNDLPLIDAVIISHNHYDHLDQKTVERLAEIQKGKGPRFFVPLGLKAWFEDLGIKDVVEMDWWDHVQYKDWTFHSVPLQHFSGRGLFDRDKTLWTGWVLEHETFKFFFAGDTGYSEDFKNIGERLGPIDLSAIPIGAYEPRWFMKAVHVNPEEAVKIHQDIKSRYSVGMHWGTFVLTDEDMDEPPKHLNAALKKEKIPQKKFFIMRHGQTRALDFLF